MGDGFVWTECDYGTITGFDAAAAVDAIVKWLTAMKKGGCKGVARRDPDEWCSAGSSP